MRHRMSVAVLLVLLVALGSALTAVAVGTTAADQPVTLAEDSPANPTTNGSESPANGSTTPTLGSKMSAFMQSNAVAVDAAVETGMWTARFERANAAAKSDVIQRRIESLERRLHRLEHRLGTIENGSFNVQNPRAAVTVSALAARIQALQRAINTTDRVARRAGINTTRLEKLRSQASNMSGHRIASIARNLTVGPPAGVPGGPPTDHPGGPKGAAGTG
ncbi:MAG: hypothetical protein ABEJ47_01040, partial [Halorhabdus sp.]